jgi:hypothetical protein
VTSPADLPPPEPERGDPVRLRWFWGLLALGAVFVLVAAVLSGLGLGWRPPVIAAGVAIVCAGAALGVLAFGRPQ